MTALLAPSPKRHPEFISGFPGPCTLLILRHYNGLTMEGRKSIGAVVRTFPGNASMNKRAWKAGDCNFESAFLGDHFLNQKRFRMIKKI